MTIPPSQRPMSNTQREIKTAGIPATDQPTGIAYAYEILQANTNELHKAVSELEQKLQPFLIQRPNGEDGIPAAAGSSTLGQRLLDSCASIQSLIKRVNDLIACVDL